jgi:hypothetical protein
MAGLFYQGNFCAECGNTLTAGRRFWPNYFCDDCAARLGRSRHTKLLSALFIGAVVALLAFTSRQIIRPIDPAAVKVPSASVSALDATARQKLVLDVAKPEASTRVLCGARTLKGTPCRHRVLPGQRCTQHRGRPSMLKTDTTTVLLDAPKPVN